MEIIDTEMKEIDVEEYKEKADDIAKTEDISQKPEKIEIIKKENKQTKKETKNKD